MMKVLTLLLITLCGIYHINAQSVIVPIYSDGVPISPVNIICLPTLSSSDQLLLSFVRLYANSSLNSISDSLAELRAQLSNITTAGDLANLNDRLSRIDSAINTLESVLRSVRTSFPNINVAVNVLLQNALIANVNVNKQIVYSLQVALANARAANSTLVPALEARLRTANADLEEALREAIGNDLVLLSQVSPLCQQAIDEVVTNLVQLYTAYENLLVAQIQYDANRIILANLVDPTSYVNDIINRTNTLLNLINDEANAVRNASLSIRARVEAYLFQLLNRVIGIINDVICALNRQIANSTGATRLRLIVLRNSLLQILTRVRSTLIVVNGIS